MKFTLQIFLSVLLMMTVSFSFSQSKIWTKSNKVINTNTLSKFHLETSKVKTFTFNYNSLSQRIQLAPVRGFSKSVSKTIIEIPAMDGEFEQFIIYEAQIFSPELALLYPDIKSYVGYSVEDSRTRLNMSVSPQGVQTMISYVDKETVFMMPMSHGSSEYFLYTKSSRGDHDSEFICNTLDELVESSNDESNSEFQKDADDQTLRSYRLAVSVNGEYSAYHGGTVAGALAGINATLTRVNAVFETDMAITFTLVNAPQLIFTNANTDPYSNNLGDWNVQLQNTLTNTIGNDAYDIGHMFGATGGGGNAGCIGCVCEDDTASTDDENKGAGITSPADDVPETDTFDIDYVAHEIGHQMGANHTWAFANEGTGVNSEPGSGSTIMGYAGIADDFTGNSNENVQTNSDPYFHYHSINQILNNVTSAPNNCAVTTTISNNPPVADAGANFTIPKGTAYILKGTAIDADGGDALTYCWEQTDSGTVPSAAFGPTLALGSMNRSLPPTTSPNRYIPNLKRVLNNQLTETNPGLNSDWETVATVARNLTWALTVRDREPTGTRLNGQTSFDLTSLTVNETAGPFMITSQNDGRTWLSETNETITWDVAGTTANGVNTSTVNILLSTDGGLNFNTILASNTPNDGSEIIIVPDAGSVSCRIMIEAVGNIFYAVNSEEFPLDFEVIETCTEYASGNLGLSIPDAPGDDTPGVSLIHSINITDAVTVDQLKVNLDVSHTYIGDLVISLSRPSGTAVSSLWNRTCNNDSFEDFDVTFMDNAPTPICDSPTVGTYRPVTPFEVFNGVDSAGDWTLSITDFFIDDVGTLNDWFIEVCTKTVTSLNIDKTTLGEFKIFPNPNKGEFTITLDSSSKKDITVEVFDIRGRKILNNVYGNNSDFNQIVSLNNVQSGIYVVTINDGDKKVTKKIIIE